MMDNKAGKEVAEENTEKYFNEKEYNTLIVPADGSMKKADDKANETEELFELLCSADHEHKDAALGLLKKDYTLGTLTNLIKQTENKTHKAALVAACWEIGFDIKGHEFVFAELATNTDAFVSLEAITVLENAMIAEEVTRHEVIALLNKAAQKHPNEVMLEDLKQRLAGND